MGERFCFVLWAVCSVSVRANHTQPTIPKQRAHPLPPLACAALRVSGGKLSLPKRVGGRPSPAPVVPRRHPLRAGEAAGGQGGAEVHPRGRLVHGGGGGGLCRGLGRRAAALAGVAAGGGRGRGAAGGGAAAAASVASPSWCFFFGGGWGGLLLDG